MFQIEQELHEIRLKDEHNTVHIWPEHGAILNAWESSMGGQNLSLIEGYDHPADFVENGEAKGFRSMKLSPYVCRMENGSYTLDNKAYTVEKFYLGSSAIHGLLYNVPFMVTDREANEDHACVTLKHDYEATDPGYPFRYTLEVTYTLRPGNRINLENRIKNTGDKAIPVADGWHPYFTLGGLADDWQLQMNASQMVEFDDRLLPSGRLLPDSRFLQPASLSGVELDNCFLLDDPGNGVGGRLIHPGRQIAIELHPSEGYPYMQVYTPPHRGSIAIENLSSAPDSFNNGMGLYLLAPGEWRQFSTLYRFTKL